MEVYIQTFLSSAQLACVAGRRAREGKGGIGLGGEEEGTIPMVKILNNYYTL